MGDQPVGAIPGNPHRADALALIRAASPHAVAEAGHLLDPLCRAIADGLSLVGAVATMASGSSYQQAGTSGGAAERLGSLEFSLGEGPAHEVRVVRRPVLTPALEGAGGASWPAYGRAAADLGVGGVFAFPLHVGAVQLGVLTLFRSTPDPLVPDHFAIALTYAEIATETLLDGAGESTGGPPQLDIDGVLDAHAEVYQAQGMIVVQLGISLADALARLRARAFAEDRDLTDLARDVVRGRERFDLDERG